MIEVSKNIIKQNVAYLKLGVNNSLDAVVHARQLGLLE